MPEQSNFRIGKYIWLFLVLTLINPFVMAIVIHPDGLAGVLGFLTNTNR